MDRQRILPFCGSVAILAGACDEPPRPWQGRPDGGVIRESEPFLPERRDASSWLGDASFADGGDDDGGTEVVPPRPPSRVGGLWVSCYGGFSPSDDPLRDVTRLGLMCGPVNGMSRLGGTKSGELAPGKVSRLQFPAKAGECYRVFAVASGVADLDVTVKSSQDTTLTADHTEDRWPIVEPERPFCTFHDDTFTVELTTGQGGGRYAAEVWRLPPPG